MPGDDIREKTTPVGLLQLQLQVLIRAGLVKIEETTSSDDGKPDLLLTVHRDKINEVDN